MFNTEKSELGKFILKKHPKLDIIELNKTCVHKDTKCGTWCPLFVVEYSKCDDKYDVVLCNGRRMFIKDVRM